MKKTNLNFFRESVLKIIIGGVAIFSFGIFVGYQLDNNSISSIQGFLFNAISGISATNTNATDSNATDSNATNSNAIVTATNSNATDSNATSGNVHFFDNVMNLVHFDIVDNNVKAGEKLNITLGTNGAYNSGASIVFKNNSNGVSFVASVQSIYSMPYIVIPSNIPVGTYSVTDVLLVGRNSNNTTFSRSYSVDDHNADYVSSYINKSINVTNNAQVSSGVQITDALKESFSNNVKVVVAQVENQYTVAQTLNKEFSTYGSCMQDWAGINEIDYEACVYSVDNEGNAKVTLVGKGKYNGLKVENGTRNSATVIEEVTKLTLEKISLKGTEANVNEKVYIDFKTNISISSMKLTFNDNLGKTMTVYVKSLLDNPYFEIPTTTSIGSYSLSSAVISSNDFTTVYSKNGNISGSEVFNFNSTIKVNDVKQQDLFVYNNEDITNEIIRDLQSSKSNAEININASTDSIISDKLFDAIKGTDKKFIITYNDNEIIFKGKDISNSKSIDASIKVNTIDVNTNIGKLVNDGIVLDFASNGNLPGDATLRIKITDDMKTKLGTGKVYVYYYNVQCNDFTEIATDLVPTSDGYYEFNISHNSEYILVNKALDTSLLSTGVDNVINFQRSDKVNLLLICLGIILILVVIIIILIVKSKKNNHKNQVTNNIYDDTNINNNNNNNFMS